MPPPENYKSEIGSQPASCQVHTGAYVSLHAPGKTDFTACHPRKTSTYITHVLIVLITARQTQVTDLVLTAIILLFRFFFCFSSMFSFSPPRTRLSTESETMHRVYPDPNLKVSRCSYPLLEPLLAAENIFCIVDGLSSEPVAHAVADCHHFVETAQFWSVFRPAPPSPPLPPPPPDNKYPYEQRHEWVSKVIHFFQAVRVCPRSPRSGVGLVSRASLRLQTTDMLLKQINSATAPLGDCYRLCCLSYSVLWQCCLWSPRWRIRLSSSLV